MSEIIDSLLDRAKEMLKGDNSREISAEEIITILKEYKKLQKELKDSINARFELQRRMDKLQKEIELKDKVIDNLYSDIEYEYSGTSYLKSLEEYYEEVKNE